MINHLDAQFNNQIDFGRRASPNLIPPIPGLMRRDDRTQEDTYSSDSVGNHSDVPNRVGRMVQNGIMASTISPTVVIPPLVVIMQPDRSYSQVRNYMVAKDYVNYINNANCVVRKLLCPAKIAYTIYLEEQTVYYQNGCAEDCPTLCCLAGSFRCLRVLDDVYTAGSKAIGGVLSTVLIPLGIAGVFANACGMCLTGCLGDSETSQKFYDKTVKCLKVPINSFWLSVCCLVNSSVLLVVLPRNVLAPECCCSIADEIEDRMKIDKIQLESLFSILEGIED